MLALEFTLVRNHLNNDGTYMAKVVNQKTINFEMLLAEMEKNTALRKSDLRLAVSQFMDAVKESLSRGLKVRTPLGEFKAVIRGSFSSLTEDFRPFADNTNHVAKVAFHTNRDFETDVKKNLAVEKLKGNRLQYPQVFIMRNASSAVEGVFRPLHVLLLIGVNLKIHADAEDEGVFWENESGGTVKSSAVIRSTRTTLHFQIPELAPGTYRIRIAVRAGNSKLRSTTLEDTVTIT